MLRKVECRRTEDGLMVMTWVMVATGIEGKKFPVILQA
jgi:hypothetical protein